MAATINIEDVKFLVKKSFEEDNARKIIEIITKNNKGDKTIEEIFEENVTFLMKNYKITKEEATKLAIKSIEFVYEVLK